jgi:hypothetical protein
MLSRPKRHSRTENQGKEPVPQTPKEMSWSEIVESLNQLLLLINQDAEAFPKKYVGLWIEVTGAIRRKINPYNQERIWDCSPYLEWEVFRHLIYRIHYQGWERAFHQTNDWSWKTGVSQMKPKPTLEEIREQQLRIDMKIQEIG